MKNKKIFFVIIFILIIIFLIFFLLNMTKKIKNGNNMSSQEFVDNFLNTNSYIAKVYVQVNSNKNTNKYILKQEFNNDGEFIQEVIEPSNIENVKLIKKENNLIIQNTQLDLTTIFENYAGLEENSLDLSSFINDYKANEKSSFEEKDGKIIMQTECENNNKYTKNKILYINKEKNIPEKLVIQDNNQKSTIIIEYNEIELK